MVMLVTLVLLIVSVASLGFSQLPHFNNSTETLSVAGRAVGDVLATVSHPYSSLIFLTDGATSAATLSKTGQLWAPWGVGTLEVRVDTQIAADTHMQLSTVIKEVRKLRQVSWCVTVVVVSDDPAFLASFAQWSLKGRLLVWSTRLLVVTRLPLPKLQQLQKTFSMTNSIIFIVEETFGSFRCSLYLHLPFAPQEAQALKVASWTPHRGLTLTTHLPLFPEKFSTFYNGSSLLVAAEEFEPHIALVREPDGSSPQVPSFTGPMVNLLEILASSMNFTYRYIRPPDGSWGVKREDGSWTGMVGMVGRGEADIGLGPFGVSATRAEMVDFTREIITETARIMGGRGLPEVDPWGFLLPLAPLVWGGILVSLLVVPAVVFVISSLSGFKTTSNALWSSDRFFGYIRVFLQQGSAEAPDLWWERAVLATWMMTMLILTKSYAGNLMSNLAVRHIPQPYQYLRDVVDDSATSMIWETNTAYVQYFRSVTSGIFKEVADAEEDGRIKYVRGAEFSTSMDTLVRRGDHVIVAEYRYERVLMAQDFSRTGRCDFYTSRDKFMPFMSSMVGPKDSPLVPVIGKSIKAVTQTGLYDHWTEAYMPNATTCAHPPTKITVNTSLALHNLWGMFVMLAGGHTVSLLVLVLELLITKLLHL